jgi:hypothetical protein
MMTINEERLQVSAVSGCETAQVMLWKGAGQVGQKAL